MFFSAHLVTTSPLAALRRKTPQAATTPGLLSARNGVCTPFTRGVMPRPQLGREAMVACWDTEEALDRFLSDDPAGKVMADGWCARLELVRSVGVWPGIDGSMKHEAGDKAQTMTGPSIALTIGTAYLKTAVSFLRVNSGLEDQFLDTPSGLWGTALANVPQRLVATLTIWEDLDAASDYMKTGAHGAAVKEHYDPRKDPTGHTFTTGGGFFGFKPLSVTGSVTGTNPLDASLLADRIS